MLRKVVVLMWASLRAAALLFASVTLSASCKHRAAAEHELVAPQTLLDGDIVFHESQSRQSEMVRALTDSRWTHMGVVFNERSGPVVLEAVSPVRKTPLKTWIARGRGQHYVAKRLRDRDVRLQPAVIQKMRALGATWLGKPYDLRFRWDDESLYCSELAYKLFERAAGVRLGELQTAAEMQLDDPRVQKAVQKRFAGTQFDPAEIVVTPDSIFNDDQLLEVEQ